MEGIQYKACTTAKPFDNGTDVGRGLLQFVPRQHVSATLVRIVAERELNFYTLFAPFTEQCSELIQLPAVLDLIVRHLKAQGSASNRFQVLNHLRGSGRCGDIIRIDVGPPAQDGLGGFDGV